MMIILLVIQIKDRLEELFGLSAKIMMTIVLMMIMIDKYDKDDKDDRPACETVWIAAFGKLSARPTGLQSLGPRNP